MKANKLSKLVGTIIIALGALNAYAQDGASNPASGVSAASSSKDSNAADRALRKDVVRALMKTKGLNLTHITVRTKNGAVMLQGSVPDQSEVDLATQAAQKVSGVTSVKNALTVIGIAGSQ